MDYTTINSETWNLWAKNGCDWSIPISHEEYIQTDEYNFIVFLTPCIPVPHEWFAAKMDNVLPPDGSSLPRQHSLLNGKRLLGLASGGGQQIPIFSKLGADCTVFDYSDMQLEAERIVMQREGYSAEIVKGDMSERLPFEDESFDLIFHPVSNLYVEDIFHVWKECFRVLRKGGILLAGFSNGIDFLFEDENPLLVVNRLPYNPLKMPVERREEMIKNGEGLQFSHSLEEQIGGQLKAGFILEDIYEDRDRENGAEIRKFAPQYIATRAVKPY